MLPLPDRRAEVLEALRSIQEPALAQPGCAACHICEEQEPERAIVLVQRWESEAAIRAHIRSDMYDRVLGALDLSSGPPEIRFDHVVLTEGIQFIERARIPVGRGGR
jgi:quinol monooxygenase YgiN